MKPTPQEQRIVERMSSGVLSREGFLGGEQRTLNEIIDTDTAQVESLGLTNEQIGEDLERMLETVMGGFGAPVRIGEHLTGVFSEAMGPILCPWGGGCGRFRKGQAEIRDRRTGGVFYLTPLSVHMIRSHGFYQGRGSKYRLEPLDLARMLGLV